MNRPNEKKSGRGTLAAFLLTISGLLLTGLALASDEKAPPPGQTGGATGAPLKGQKEKVSYALGVEFGKGLRKQSVDVTPEIFLEGLKDALAGSDMRLTEEELKLTLVDLQAELKRKQSASEAEKVLAANRVAEQSKSDGEAFLAANKTRSGVVTLESGLQYRILKAGDGPKPSADSLVVCNYRGTLLDGTEFDSSYKRKSPPTFPLKGVIKGWAEAIQLMPVGSKWELFIPADLAYGARGNPKSQIGPNATLIFEVELVSIKEPSASAAGPVPKEASEKVSSTRPTEKK